MASTYEDLAAIRAKLQNLMASMMALKHSGQGGPARRHLMTEAAVLLIELRQLNRVILKNEEDIKLQTESAKAPVDSTTLKLHNLLYEKNHYVKAIKACNDFKSKYPDIDLVTEEEFFRDAPDEFKGDPVLRNDPHKLMLQRLNYELYQRKELVKQREVLEIRKRTLQDSINSRKKFLATLPEHLKTLKAASLPVQQQLGLLHSKKLQQHKRAELLPASLYILYSQLISYRDAFKETITVEIVGSFKEATELIRTDALRNAGIGQEADESNEDDVLDDEDDGTRRRKRRKHADNVPIHAGSEAISIHPLTVVLQVYSEEGDNVPSSKTNDVQGGAPLAVINFEYIRTLNLVYAFADGDDGNLLANLFPGDTGLEFPNSALKLRSKGVSPESSHQHGRPYKWAQHLAGLDFLPELPPSFVSDSGSDIVAGVTGGLDEYRRQHRVHILLQQLRLRCKAVKALKEQLESLRKLKRPPLPRGFEKIGGRDSTPKCTLRNWAMIRSQPRHVVIKQIQPVEEGNNSEALKGLPPSGKSGKSPVFGDESGQEDGELPGPAALATLSAAPSSLAASISETARLRNAVAASTHKSLVSSPSRLGLARVSSGELTPISGEQAELPPPVGTRDSAGGVEVSGNIHSFDEGQEQPRWQDFGLQRFRAVFRSDYPSTSLEKRTSSRMELEAEVDIYGEYPVRPPVFSLRLLSPAAFVKAPPPPDGVLEVEGPPSRASTAHYSNALRLMEAEMNVCKEELNSKQEIHVLTYQVNRLMHLFDAFVDLDATQKHFAPNTLGSSNDTPTAECVLVTRTYRGRQRSLITPTKYEATKQSPESHEQA